MTPEAYAADAAVARIVARFSAEYLLRVCELLVETYGDIRSAAIAQTIDTANTAHLDARNGAGRRYMAIDQTPPDEVRRPISIARLAESLGLPFETARRHAQWLIEAEVCVRVAGGLIVPQAFLERPEAVRSAVANVGYVRKLVRGLQAAGLDTIGRRRQDEP